MIPRHPLIFCNGILASYIVAVYVILDYLSAIYQLHSVLCEADLKSELWVVK